MLRKTPEQLKAEAEERKRLEAAKARQVMLATTHEGAMAIFGVAMLNVDDFYGRDSLLVRATNFQVLDSELAWPVSLLVD
eukprot:scaffold286175_cov15-Prasinocladus_malaysianus.AAC.1